MYQSSDSILQGLVEGSEKRMIKILKPKSMGCRIGAERELIADCAILGCS